jgi:hypothetical protein
MASADPARAAAQARPDYARGHLWDIRDDALVAFVAATTSQVPGAAWSPAGARLLAPLWQHTGRTEASVKARWSYRNRHVFAIGGSVFHNSRDVVQGAPAEVDGNLDVQARIRAYIAYSACFVEVALIAGDRAAAGWAHSFLPGAAPDGGWAPDALQGYAAGGLWGGLAP